jgi:2-dehydropantoate 2-reductase
VRRYAVVGSGAVGLFYGIQLAVGGAEVTFLDRRGAQAIRSRGVVIHSPRGDLSVTRPSVAAGWDELSPCDVLLVATKATANADVLEDLTRHADRVLPAGGAVLLIQNGIGAESGFAAAAPGRDVLAGLAFLGARRTEPGVVEHLGYGTLTLAHYRADEGPAGVTVAMNQIADDLRAGGVEVVLDDDLVRARWQKLMWNLPFNPLSVLLDASTHELVGDPDAAALVRALMAEVVEIAAAEGHPLPGGLAEILVAATTTMAPYDTSMRVDADAGRPLEVETIVGEPVRRAHRAGVPVPRAEMLLSLLRFTDRRLAVRHQVSARTPTPPRDGVSAKSR